MEVSRDLGTYADGYWLMYLLTAAAAVLFVKGIRNRRRLWSLGEGHWGEHPERRGSRLLRVASELLEHRRLLRKPTIGLAHLALLFGVLLFTAGTISVMLQEYFGLPTFRGGWYLGLSLVLDLFALLGLIAIAVLYARPRAFAAEGQSLLNGAVLPLAAAVLASGLMLEGVRMAISADPWGAWSPVGFAIASAITATGIALPDLLHQGMWWIHLLLALGLIASIPHTRLIHILAAPVSLYWSRPRSASVLEPLDFVDPEVTRFGVGRIEDYHWKHLLESDACMQCGRCHDSCPASTAGRPLSPLDFGNGLKLQLSIRKAASRQSAGHEDEGALLRSVGGEEALWSCTTCGACDASCPVGVEQVSRLVDIRRYEVLMEARFPSSLQQTFRGLETQGNPWGLERRQRAEAAMDLEIPLLADEPEAEYILWMGCSGAYDPKSRSVLRSLSELLRRAEIRFATLGEEERCCGDAARRLGNEYLFQSLARENIESLNRGRKRTILTVCPHCSNTLGNEYPQFAGNYEVLHHTQLLARLMEEGGLRLEGEGKGGKKVVFHDPCYLGRHGGVFKEPRKILSAARGDDFAELKRSGVNAFCCGAGGGRMWMEEGEQGSIAKERAAEIAESGAAIVCTACPFCRTMLSDALSAMNSSIEVVDVVEMVKSRSQEPGARSQNPESRIQNPESRSQEFKPRVLA
jgi:Fe-S oxidoreductase